MTLDGDTTNGVITLETGRAVLALYAFRPSGNNTAEMTYRGEREVEFTCGDALCPGTPSAGPGRPGTTSWG